MNNKDLSTIGLIGTIIWSVIIFYSMLNETFNSNQWMGYLAFYLVSFTTIYYIYYVVYKKNEMSNNFNKIEYENQLLEKKIEQKKLFEELENLSKKL